MDRTLEQIASHFGKVSSLLVASWLLKRLVGAAKQDGEAPEEAQRLRKRTTSSYKLLAHPDSQYELATPAWLRQLAAWGEHGLPPDVEVPQPPHVAEALERLRETGPSMQLGSEAVLEQLFLLQRGSTRHFLNAGSFGGAYRLAVQAQRWWQDQLEAEPVRFFERTGSAALQAAKAAVAAHIGAEQREVVALPNATTAVNTVLASVPLRPGDLVLITSVTYAAVRNAAARFAVAAGAGVLELALDLETLTAGSAAVTERLRRVLGQLGGRLRLAILDHITSAPTFHMPVAELAAVCRQHGAKVLIDGAHAFGALPLSVPSLGAHYYTANLHKWGNCPKSGAFLWAERSCQAGLRPLATSHGYRQGFQGEFAWQGTLDPSAWLAAPAALAVQAALGAERVRRHNHAMLLAGVALLRQAWGRQLPVLGAEPAASHMASVQLPPLPGFAATAADAAALHSRLLSEHSVQVPVSAWEGRLWVRISAQIYNTEADYRALAGGIAALAAAEA